jgi:hypothetical protein
VPGRPLQPVVEPGDGLVVARVIGTQPLHPSPRRRVKRRAFDAHPLIVGRPG